MPVFTYSDGKSIQPISFKGIETEKYQNTSVKCLDWETKNHSTGALQTYWIEASSARLMKSKSVLENGVIFWILRKEN